MRDLVLSLSISPSRAHSLSLCVHVQGFVLFSFPFVHFCLLNLLVNIRSVDKSKIIIEIHMRRLKFILFFISTWAFVCTILCGTHFKSIINFTQFIDIFMSSTIDLQLSMAFQFSTTYSPHSVSSKRIKFSRNCQQKWKDLCEIEST